MSREQQQQRLRRLAKKYNIDFIGLAGKAEWPDSHKRTFADIQALGRTLFEDYCETVTFDSRTKPWREQTRRRAERLAEAAVRCRREVLNEAGWRLRVEHEVFDRFAVEVACQKCRARLWRSEVEATIGVLSRIAVSLEERRKRRVACTCDAGARGNDHRELGLHPLFSDRTQELILHDAPLKSELSKQEQPDRVFGLRLTSNFERLLESEDKRTLSSVSDKLLCDSIKTTPFNPAGDPLLFPFLVLEAKSEKGRDSFESMEMQTAFSIRTLLLLQKDLQMATGPETEWDGGPLVWFFSNKGEEWRISACYVENKAGTHHYRILDLWSGRIISKDSALQLLLIIDYICDWARDLYRPAILRELKILAAADASSLTGDSDIFSLEGPVPDWLSGSPGEIQQDRGLVLRPSAKPPGIPEALLALDSVYGVIRDASFIESRLFALCITGDTVQALMNSLTTSKQAILAARQILSVLKDSWRVSGPSLDAMARKWTGTSYECDYFHDPELEFYTKITFSAYLSQRWEQVRELSYLAVSPDGVEALLQISKRHHSYQPNLNKQPLVEQHVLENFCITAQKSSIEDNLMAAILKTSLSNGSTQSAGDSIPQSRFFQTVDQLDTGFVNNFNGRRARSIVSSFYKIYENRMGHPLESLLRVSSLHEEQESLANPTSFWDLPLPLSINPNGSILIHSKHANLWSRGSELCLYTVHGPADVSDPSTLQRSIENVFKTGPTYTTARQENLSSWNLKSVQILLKEMKEAELVPKWVNYLGRSGRYASRQQQDSSSNTPTPTSSGSLRDKGKRVINPDMPQTPLRATVSSHSSSGPSSSSKSGPSSGGSTTSLKRSIDLTDDDASPSQKRPRPYSGKFDSK